MAESKVATKSTASATGQADIVRHALADGELSLAQLRTAASDNGLSESALQRTLRKLVADGSVERVRRGVYQLAPQAVPQQRVAEVAPEPPMQKVAPQLVADSVKEALKAIEAPPADEVEDAMEVEDAVEVEAAAEVEAVDEGDELVDVVIPEPEQWDERRRFLTKAAMPVAAMFIVGFFLFLLGTVLGSIAAVLGVFGLVYWYRRSLQPHMNSEKPRTVVQPAGETISLFRMG